jgi:hypothetical protein
MCRKLRRKVFAAMRLPIRLWPGLAVQKLGFAATAMAYRSKAGGIAAERRASRFRGKSWLTDLGSVGTRWYPTEEVRETQDRIQSDRTPFPCPRWLGDVHAVPWLRDGRSAFMKRVAMTAPQKTAVSSTKPRE